MSICIARLRDTSNALTSLMQSWTWIGSIHRLDWTGSGFSGNVVDLFGFGRMTATPFY